MSANLLPWAALNALLARDAASARLTFYERTPGATAGERIELSGKVLANWVNKAANFLVEEFDIEPGARIGIELPAAHWRTAYWCLAAWSVGAQVVFVDSDAESDRAALDEVELDDVEVLVTLTPNQDVGEDQIVVSLPMLARNAPQALPAGAHDEAKELPTFADGFTPLLSPAPGELALTSAGGEYTFADLTAGGSHQRCFLSHPDPASIMRSWAADGSVVLVRGPVEDDDLQAILAQENVENSGS